jgi:hypothetical protein
VVVLEGNMDKAQPTISYEQFWSQPFDERGTIFEEITPENRALVMKTHTERWLEANRIRLSAEQVEVVEEVSAFVTPDKYDSERRDMGKVHEEAEVLRKKAIALLTPEDAGHILSPRPDYVLVVGEGNG